MLMQTRDDIYIELKNILGELFEIDESEIHPDVRLYEDLDLDSIDAIDMVIKLQQITGKKVRPEDFKSARNVNDIVEAVYALIQN